MFSLAHAISRTVLAGAWLLTGSVLAHSVSNTLNASTEPPASESGKDKHAVKHVQASIICEKSGLVPGKSTMIGLHFVIAPEWHMYWNGLNDSGGHPKVKWTLPAGYSVGELQWPAPKRKLGEEGLVDHVYEDAVTLMAPLTVPANAKPGESVVIKGELEWLVCSDTCVFEDASVKASLSVLEPMARQNDSADAGKFKSARERIPQPVASADKSPVTVTRSREAVQIAVAGARSMAFYPAKDCTEFAKLAEDGQTQTGRLRLRLADPSTTARLKGVLEVFAVGPKGGAPMYLLSIDQPLPAITRDEGSNPGRAPLPTPPAGKPGPATPGPASPGPGDPSPGPATIPPRPPGANVEPAGRP